MTCSKRPGSVSLEKVVQVAFHRNGVSGTPFHVILFTSDEAPANPKMAVVFDQPGAVAVFDLDLLSEGVIKFGQNSFRGDDFEPDLRLAIDDAMGNYVETPLGYVAVNAQVQ